MGSIRDGEARVYDEVESMTKLKCSGAGTQRQQFAGATLSSMAQTPPELGNVGLGYTFCGRPGDWKKSGDHPIHDKALGRMAMMAVRATERRKAGCGICRAAHSLSVTNQTAINP
jgi:hypothetical protein